MLKMAVLAPMPSASVATTISANDGRLVSERTANFRFWAMASIVCLRAPVSRCGVLCKAYLRAIDSTCTR